MSKSYYRPDTNPIMGSKARNIREVLTKEGCPPVIRDAILAVAEDCSELKLALKQVTAEVNALHDAVLDIGGVAMVAVDQLKKENKKSEKSTSVMMDQIDNNGE